MLSVAHVRQQSARLIRAVLTLGVAGLLAGSSFAVPVYATNTSVNAQVRDDQPASLTVTTDIEGKTVTLPTVTVEGAVHNISQVVVYVDGIYNTSIPLATGAATYTVAFGVTPGSHEVRLTGLDASTGDEVSVTIHFTYTPSATGTTDEGGTTNPVNDYVNNTIDAAKATGDAAAEQVQKASSSGPLGDLSDVAFAAFKSVDLLSTTDGTGVNKMAGRFTLVTAGLAATVFPWSAYALIEKIRFIPKFALPPNVMAGAIRVTGIAMILVPFLFIH